MMKRSELRWWRRYESYTYAEVFREKEVYRCIRKDTKILNKPSQRLFIKYTFYSCFRFLGLVIHSKFDNHRNLALLCKSAFSIIRVPPSGLLSLLFDTNHRKIILYNFSNHLLWVFVSCCTQIPLLWNTSPCFLPTWFCVLWNTILNGDLVIRDAFLDIYERTGFFKNRFYWKFSFCCCRHLATDSLLATKYVWKHTVFSPKARIVNGVHSRDRTYVSVYKASDRKCWSNQEFSSGWVELGHIRDSGSWLYILS